MKSALIFLSLLTGLSLIFVSQGTPPVECRGKVLPLTLYEFGMKMTGPDMPARFGKTRPFPRIQIKTDKPFRRVIKNQDEYNEFWKLLMAPVLPGNWVPPQPEIDFAKEMLVVSANGQRPSSGYWTIIDGACETDGQLEIFITNLEEVCGGALMVLTYPADAVRIPRSDSPVVFRETQIRCDEWRKNYVRY
jgi:hypothetical protein